MRLSQKIASISLAALMAACSDSASQTSTMSNAAANDFMSQMGPNGDRVFFAFNQSDVTVEGQETLTRQATWLNANPSVAVTIEGHCDVRGTDAYNMGLGERRANASKNYLVALGLQPARAEVVSYGKGRPAVLGNDETAHAQNRRAVTVVR